MEAGVIWFLFLYYTNQMPPYMQDKFSVIVGYLQKPGGAK